MAKRPCSKCGELRYVGRGSRPEIVCHACRRRDKPPGTKRERKKAPIFTCERAGCDKTFKAKRSIGPKYAARFCSRECSAIARAGTSASRLWKWRCLIQWVTCPECDGPMVGQSRRKYCSEECVYVAQKRRQRERYQATRKPRPTYVVECPCETVFEASSPTAIYCSDRCRRHAWGRTHRDRAAKYGRAYEAFTPRSVYERDGWACGICGDAIDPLSKWPDMMCPSLDHIVPLSKGGDHRPDNVRAAHWLCNSYRGADDDINFMVA